jgi:hypothetical protein
MKCSPWHQPAATDRHGAILAGVIIILAMIMLLAGTMVKRIVASHHRGDAHQRHLQSMLLAEAGMRRAVARLAREPDYRGEQWVVTPEQLEGAWRADVDIEVEPVPDGTDSMAVTVECRYPPHPELQVLCRRERVVSIMHAGENHEIP